MSIIEIRFAVPVEMEQIIDLCEAHARYEKADYQRAGKASRLAEDLFGEQPKLYCLVATEGEQLSGYATYMRQYSTWDAAEYVYMDCLFMREDVRGKGIGEQLVRRIQLEAQKLHCELLQWQTPDFNVRAIAFYRRLGAQSKSKERFFLAAQSRDV